MGQSYGVGVLTLMGRSHEVSPGQDYSGLYRANSFKEITGSAKTFSIGFAFLPNESIESYTFAFEEFKKPSIIPWS
jgi:hypothetical protein